ncbi:hypothetical protein N7486_008728 [Penicillium sp. IBT 16267x]|nr:hypothetical protein N7486_008728 [Penicillium sp. IBT 16267x]
MKRKIDSLEEDRELLLQLVGNLRESSNSRVVQLLNLIRSNAPLEEIKVYMDKKMRGELETTPELVDVARNLEESEARARRRLLDVRRLADDPLWKVPAKPWTIVTDDDGFVSHLVSLWFTWFHPFFNYLDRDLFIKNMQSGDPANSLYCSPFLVNTILADACFYSDYPEAFSRSGDSSSRGQHFYKEAKRLYESEEGRVSLPLVQGLTILFGYAALSGKDRRGWLYQGQLSFAVNELTEQYESGKDTRYDPEVLNSTLWGVYHLAATSSLTYHKRPLVKVPKIPYSISPTAQNQSSDLWTPYPSLMGGVPAHTARVAKALADINQATFESSSWFFKNLNDLENMSFDEVQDAAAELYSRLQEWQAHLDDRIRVENSNVPHVLCLHMSYHNIIMNIHGFVEKRARQEDLRREKYQYARDLRFNSARAVGRLSEIHRAAWGNDRVPSGNIQWLSIAECTLLEDLDNPENRQAFINLCISTKASARRWHLVKGILRTIQMAANELRVTLPSETDALFASLDSSWTSKEEEDIVSQYPNFAISLKSDRMDEAELDNFLEKRDAL